MIKTSKKRFWVRCILIISILGINACNLINPEEQAPGFIVINGFDFNPVPTAIELGPSTSVKIKDVWVYIGNEFQGAYQLPARFPVLKTGNQKILLTPGIELNGIASTRSPYPFYSGYDSTHFIPENGTLTLNPQARYFDAVQCAFCESFDGSGFALAPTNQSDTIMYQLAVGDSNVFEGASSGVVYLDGVRSQFEFSSTSFYDLPGSGAAVYLEMDYKCSQEMQIGLYIDVPGTGLQQIPIYNVNQSAEWNKVYIQLGYVVSTYSYADKFKVYFKGIKNSGSANASFYFDNIKVVHF